MQLFKQQDLFKKFDELLDRELALVAAGRFQELTKLVPEKEKLIATLTSTNSDVSRLSGLRQKAERNQRILEATRQGVKEALDRVEQIFAGQAELTTYNRGGGKVDAGQVKSTIRKRA